MRINTHAVTVTLCGGTNASQCISVVADSIHTLQPTLPGFWARELIGTLVGGTTLKTRRMARKFLWHAGDSD